jgi:two-component system NtrC family response regulator
MADILVVDDDPPISRMMARALEPLGHAVHPAYTLEEGLRRAGEGSFSAVFLDIFLPDGNGLDWAPEFMALASEPQTVIITGAREVRSAELALKAGVFDYLQKPFAIEEVRLTCTRALEFRESRRSQPAVRLVECDGLVGGSGSLKTCLHAMARASGGLHSILITGETGTGKELLARAVHANSPRAEKSFITVDCAALKDTLLESALFGHEKGAFTGAEVRREGLVALAHKGTLFLDEIGELSLDAQKKFLRLLEGKRFYPLGAKTEVFSDFRLVTATNRELEAMVAAGAFRQDLYYRIRGQEIRLPPLRERREDIRDLVFHYTEKICRRMQIPAKRVYPEFLEALARLDWPGNVRELVNSLDEAISGFPDDPALQIRHLPSRLRIALADLDIEAEGPSDGPPDTQAAAAAAADAHQDWKTVRRRVLDGAEKSYFQTLFHKSNGRVKEMARRSGLTPARVYDLIKKHNIG